jgi:hypothetical protein
MISSMVLFFKLEGNWILVGVEVVVVAAGGAGVLGSVLTIGAEAGTLGATLVPNNEPLVAGAA